MIIIIIVISFYYCNSAILNTLGTTYLQLEDNLLLQCKTNESLNINWERRVIYNNNTERDQYIKYNNRTINDNRINITERVSKGIQTSTLLIQNITFNDGIGYICGEQFLWRSSYLSRARMERLNIYSQLSCSGSKNISNWGARPASCSFICTGYDVLYGEWKVGNSVYPSNLVVSVIHHYKWNISVTIVPQNNRNYYGRLTFTIYNNGSNFYRIFRF